MDRVHRKPKGEGRYEIIIDVETNRTFPQLPVVLLQGVIKKRV